MAYTSGDRVMHTQYGDGTIVSANEYRTVIDFDGHGVRTFSSPRVELAASHTPAPVKPTRAKGKSKAAIAKAAATKAAAAKAAAAAAEETDSEETDSDEIAAKETASE